MWEWGSPFYRPGFHRGVKVTQETICPARPSLKLVAGSAGCSLRPHLILPSSLTISIIGPQTAWAPAPMTLCAENPQDTKLPCLVTS